MKRKSGSYIALASFLAFGGISVPGWPNPSLPMIRPKELTRHDMEAIEKARIKRERKAAKKGAQ